MLRTSRPKNMYMSYTNDSSEVRNMEDIKSEEEHQILEKSDLRLFTILLTISAITHWIFLYFFILGLW